MFKGLLDHYWFIKCLVIVYLLILIVSRLFINYYFANSCSEIINVNKNTLDVCTIVVSNYLYRA